MPFGGGGGGFGGGQSFRQAQPPPPQQVEVPLRLTLEEVGAPTSFLLLWWLALPFSLVCGRRAFCSFDLSLLCSFFAAVDLLALSLCQWTSAPPVRAMAVLGAGLGATIAVTPTTATAACPPPPIPHHS